VINVIRFNEEVKQEAVVVVSQPPPVIKKPTKEYRLLYPEIPLNGSRYNGIYKIELEGKITDHEIMDGVITVTDERESDILKSKGFIFMYEKEI